MRPHDLVPLGFAQVSAPELDDDETSINRQVVRLMGLTEDTEDNHWLSIHALRMRYSDASIIQPMAMRLWAKGETSHMYKMYAPRGLTDTDAAVVVQSAHRHHRPRWYEVRWGEATCSGDAH